MPWETIKSNDGIYLIDWDGLTRIIRSCVRAKKMRAYSKVEPTEKHWIGPDLYSVEVQWDKVRLETTIQTEVELRKFHAGALGSMQTELNRIISMMEDADDDRDAFQDRMAEAQQTTMENVESSVHKGEIGVEVATFVRDASAETVMVGATYLSGGTALAFIGTGSAMKGAFVYQDTGKARQALATFSTNLVLGVADVKVGASLDKIASKAERIGMAIVWAKAKATLETPKGLIEGKNLSEAASSSGVKLAASTPVTAGVEQLKSVLEARELKPWAIPVEVALNLLQDKGGEMLAKSGEKEQRETKGPPAHLPHPHPNHHLMDAVIYDRSMIEQSAVRKIGSGPFA
jgi:hypothetical protein